jgi:type IV secretory pathway VirD2 relaxase
MTDDSDRFSVRPGKVGNRGGGDRVRMPRAVRARPKSFIGEVHAAIRRDGGNPYALRRGSSGRYNARGRGREVAASLKSHAGWRLDGGGRTRTRRVAVKARIVKLNPQRGGYRGRQFVSAKAVDAHLRYLERDGVTRDGDVYDAGEDEADGRAFLDRGREDRHQFRFIVSAEEGVELSDPRQTIRDLMRQMEIDLETRLDWIAVDHHNTGHPHSHILVRGVTDDGKMLNIAGDYISHGIRERASEIVTLELGRQTEQEVSRQLESEVHAERFTRLDRMLIAEQQASNQFTDLRPDKSMRDMFRTNRALLIERARKLERLGLATEVTPGQWTISGNAEQILRDLGTRNDIIKTMHKALEREGLDRQRGSAQYTLHPNTSISQTINGRVISKGLGSDELSERIHLVIDGTDGLVHHIEVDATHAEGISRNMIVEASPALSKPRASDLNIAELANDQGIYRPSAHLVLAQKKIEQLGGDPQAFVQSHVRRLEALRRAGHVTRIDADRWQIPDDLTTRGMHYDAASDGGAPKIRALSPLSLSQQIAHEGATWLDRELVATERTPLSNTGFGHEVATALDKRKAALVDMGYAQGLGNGHIRAPRDLLAQLRTSELERIGRQLARAHGRAWEPAIPGSKVSGTLIGSAQLASGRFAMIDDGLGFSLVPWRKELDQSIGQQVSGMATRGGGIEWTLGRSRGLAI